MTDQQLAAMAAGRQRAQVRRQRHAVERVQAFKRWLAAESKALASGDREHWREILRAIPAIPSDRDYRLAGVA